LPFRFLLSVEKKGFKTGKLALACPEKCSRRRRFQGALEARRQRPYLIGNGYWSNTEERMITTMRNLGEGLSRAWSGLADGWRELWRRSGDAMTRFLPREPAGTGESDFPTWAILAGEIADTGKDLVVRLEMPGVDRDDCEVVLTRDLLRVEGEKRVDREMIGADYYVKQRAYGRFQLSIPLPLPVDADRALASFRNGVLMVRAPKLDNGGRRRVSVH
jgi:HSP20 family protein